MKNPVRENIAWVIIICSIALFMSRVIMIEVPKKKLDILSLNKRLNKAKQTEVNADGVDLSDRAGDQYNHKSDNTGYKPKYRSRRPPGLYIDPFMIKKSSNGKYILKRSIIASYQSKPEKLFAEAQLQPQIENNEPSGRYIIQSLKDDCVLRKVGLRKGDVIDAINGQPAINLLNLLKDTSLEYIGIEYLRGGRLQCLRYIIQD